MPTTAATARPYRRLTAVPNTGLTVPANAKPNTTTTAATGLRSFPPVRQTRPVLTSPTVLRKSAVGLATQAIQNPEALVQKYLATYVRPATASLTAAAAVTDLRRPERKQEAFVQNVVLRRKIPMVISACNALIRMQD